MNQIINMIIRQVMNQVIRRGISAGFDRMGNGSRKGNNQPADALDDNGNPVQPQMTQAERQQKRQAQQTAGRGKQSLKAMRKISRF
ncbi:hypothetical protein Z945_2271 [Sulfitobacter noctilucae]|uniref:hypothetical protein n=1 Tax=Sulfitobacter noctilucae TaxID=1342302 RepID=UPI001269032C|nr:hypothetical protein [Sulfitobacter noctilucae]KIN61280.1 hypothetical protein Z945_2271 [Sulfitobacter noctilucae]